MPRSAPELIFPHDAALQLEQAQCAPSKSVGAILRALVPRLSRAHPVVSEAVLTLLQIHPHETLPYLPDLLSTSVDDTTNALEILSTLLQSDRTLLVPIIATLPQLPLSCRNIVHARATLAFAINVVHQHDLPAVIHALLNTTTTSTSALWASRTIRTGLARATLDPTSTPLLAHVLSNALNTNIKVSRALRSQAGFPFLWPDLLIWTCSLAPRLPSPSPARETQSSIHNAVNTTLLIRPQYICAAVRQIAPVLCQSPFATERFVSMVIDACPPRVAEVAGSICLIRAITRACPSASSLITSHLCTHDGAIPQIVIRTLAQMGFSVPAASFASAVSNNSSAAEHAPVFVKMRKYLLFGQEFDRHRALLVANTICTHASLPVVRELLTLLHESVSYSLADGAAIATLAIVTYSVMRGISDTSFLKTVLSSRVMEQCPSGCFEEQPDNDARAVGISDAVAVKIDVGLIWNQPPSAVASIVSAAITYFAVQRDVSASHTLSFQVLNIVVLVPVVCISLYEAVDHLNQTSTYGNWDEVLKYLSEPHEDDTCIEFPSDVLDMDWQDLLRAVKSFAVGISVIVGILNTSSRSLTRCERVINRRASANDDEFESVDHKATWALLERLTELHRMMNAMSVAHELLLQKSDDGGIYKICRKATSRKKKQRSRPKQIALGEQFVSQSEGVLNAVRHAIFTGKRSCNFTELCDAVHGSFPALHLETIIATLSAVPDESEMHTRDVMTCVERDHELVQIDRFLLRLLLRTLSESTVPHSNISHTDDDINDFESETSLKSGTVNLACSSATVEDAYKMGVDEVESYFEDVHKQLDSCNDIFFNEDDVRVDENDADEGSQEPNNVNWASNPLPVDGDGLRFVDDAVSAIFNKNSKVYASTLLHSPSFAALLLDRAATYVAVSRNARLKTHSRAYLGDLVMVSGIALRSFVFILRNISFFSVPVKYHHFDTDLNDTTLDNSESGIKFLQEVNENVLTQLCPDFNGNGRAVDFESDDIHRFRRVLQTLEWIRLTTPDSFVAGIAVEALLTLAELNIITPFPARLAAFISLHTIYEFDQGSLWDDDERYLATHDSFQEWLSRRRGRISLSDACELDVVFGNGFDSPPWVILKNQGGKGTHVDSFRLWMFFTGMNVNIALLEACGWVHELSLVVAGTEDPVHCVKRIESSKSKRDTKDKGDRRIICDALIDMIGFRAIILTLLQLALLGFESFSVDESLPFDRAHDEKMSPLPGLAISVRLLCGVQQLYGDNHEAILSTYEIPTSNQSGSQVDESLEREVISAYISILKLSHRRLEELSQWYSNESMDINDLNRESISYIEHIIGGLACAISNCVRLVKLVRATDTSTDNVNVMNSNSKTPSRETKKRKKGGGELNLRTVFTRGRRLLPRLAEVCEQVRKSLIRFARSVGLSASVQLETIAAEPVSTDRGLHFGVGLASMGRKRDDDGDSNTYDESEVENAFEPDAIFTTPDVEGFHARGATNDEINIEPIPVQFRRRSFGPT